MFKKGDKVICIDNTRFQDIFIIGDIYTVKYINNYLGEQQIGLLEVKGYLPYSSRFILIEPTIKPQTEFEWIKWMSGERL